MLACVKSESKLGKTKGKMEAKNENQTLQGPVRIGGRRGKTRKTRKTEPEKTGETTAAKPTIAKGKHFKECLSVRMTVLPPIEGQEN